MKPRRARRPRLANERRFRFRFSLRKAMFVLPNLFTVSSIFCGFYAIILVSGNPGSTPIYQAALAIFFGIFFDMADGRVARLTRTQSDFGMQLDSLADVISFGVAPAVILYKWALWRLGPLGAFIAFTHVACGAMRLARFNVLATRMPTLSKKFFIGLPIPLAAGVLISLVMFHQQMYDVPAAPRPQIIAFILIISYLMVSNVRYRTFKDVKFSRKSLAIFVGSMLLFALASAALQPAFALLAFFCAYVAMGLVEEVIFFRRRRREDVKPPQAGSEPPESRTHDPKPHDSAH